MKWIDRAKIVGAQYSSYGAVLVVGVLFTVLSPRFLTGQNLMLIVLAVVEVGIIALALALLVMSGSVDLSVGSIASVSAVISTSVMVSSGSVPLGIVCGLAFGVLAGAVNGVLVAVFGLNPIVITLGFLGAWGGLALFLTGGQTVHSLPGEFSSLARWKLGPVPLPIIILVVAIIAAWFLLTQRPFGRSLLAVGGSKRAARLMGIRVRRVQFLLFINTGVASALAGIMIAGKLNSAPPTIGLSMELTALLVVLIGGVAFEGGVGRISGVVAGLLFIGVLNNGLVVAGVSQFLQAMVTGIALVVAVAIDQSIQRSVRRSWVRVGAEELERAKADTKQEN